MKKDLAKEIYDDGYVEGYKTSIEEFLEDLKLLGLLSHPIKDKWEKRGKQ